MFIDTHCHLNFKAFDDDRENIVRRSIKSGVERIIVPGTEISSSKKAIKIAQQFPSCFAAIGIHPHHAKDSELKVNGNLRKNLQNLLKGEKIVAVGEIGLDYYCYTKTKHKDTSVTDTLKHKQKQLLLLQLEIAQKLQLPLILHCRQAHDDLIELLQGFSKESHWKPKGVFHCFGGSKEHLQIVLEMGFYIGFDGNVTYNKNLHDLVRQTPLEKLLLETDSPFLTPIPYKGQRNEPKNISLVAKYIAKLKNIPLQKVKDQATKNACVLFNI